MTGITTARLFRAALITGFGIAIGGTALAAAPADGSYAGSSIGKGGTKSFCKGKTPLKAALKGGLLTISLPMASGGSATVAGKVKPDGSFAASGGRFAFSGSFAGKKASGSWKGPSCYGSFTLAR